MLSDQVINSDTNVISHYKCDISHQVINSVIIVSLMRPHIISVINDPVIIYVIMESLWLVITSVLSDQVINSVIIVSLLSVR